MLAELIKLLPMNMRLPGSFVLGLLLLLSGLQGADESSDAVVELANGDRIAGQLIRSDEAGQLVVMHAVLGRLVIPAASATVISGALPEPEPAQPESPAEAQLEPGVAAAPATPVVPAAQDPRPVNGNMLRDWRAYLSVFPLLEFALADDPFAGWKHRFSAGYRWNSGKFDNQQLLFGYESNRKIDKKSEMRLNLTYEYAYYRNGDDEKVTTKDLFRGEMRFRRQWSEDWFIQSTNRYRREPTRRVEHDVAITAGLGYRFLNDEKLTGNIVPSLTFSYLETETTLSGDGDRLLATLFQDFGYQFNKQWSLIQTFEWNRDLRDGTGSFANVGVRMQTRLFEQLGFNNRIEVIYDERGSKIDKYERRFLSELVYEF